MTPALHGLEMFQPNNLFNMLSKKQKELKEAPLIKSLLLQSLAGASVQPGQQTRWSQCDDDFGIFTLDQGFTESVPNPPQKDQEVILKLFGAISDDIRVERITVHTDWEDAALNDDE